MNLFYVIQGRKVIVIPAEQYMKMYVQLIGSKNPSVGGALVAQYKSLIKKRATVDVYNVVKNYLDTVAKDVSDEVSSTAHAVLVLYDMIVANGNRKVITDEAYRLLYEIKLNKDKEKVAAIQTKLAQLNKTLGYVDPPENCIAGGSTFSAGVAKEAIESFK